MSPARQEWVAEENGKPNTPGRRPKEEKKHQSFNKSHNTVKTKYNSYIMIQCCCQGLTS